MRWTTFILILMIAFTACASNRYNVKLREAQNNLEKRNYAQAITEIQKLIKLYPDEPQPYYLLGSLYFQQRNYNECLVYFDKAERFSFKATRKYYSEKGIALYHTGDFKEAEVNLRLSTDIGSTPGDQRYLGKILYRAGDYAGAVISLIEASALFPEDVELFSCLGMALYNEGKTAESLVALKRALSLAPEDSKIRVRIAHMLMLDGQYHEAAALYEKIPPDSPYRDESVYNMSEAYIGFGDYDTAAALLKEYTTNHPDNYEALCNLAAALIKTGDYSAAVDILTTLSERKELDIRGTYNLGLAYQGLEAYKQSLSPLSSVVENDPDNIFYRYAYGISLIETGDIDGARDQMESILLLTPSHKTAREWLERHRAPAPVDE